MSERTNGFIFLYSGLLVMLFAFSIVILVFLGKIEPYKFFEIPAPSIDTANLVPSIPGVPKPAGQKIEFLPTKDFNRILNIGITYFLMTFILSFGFKISDLGVKLVRPIKIESKNQTVSSHP